MILSTLVIPAPAGIQVCLRSNSLDTRPRFREGMLSNRGYDGNAAVYFGIPGFFIL
jgi:hypothetical protein